MGLSCTFHRFVAGLILPLSLCCLATRYAFGQEHTPQDHQEAAPPPKAPPPSPDAKSEPLPPLPSDASAEQTVTLNGNTLHYTATVGVIPVYNCAHWWHPGAIGGDAGSNLANYVLALAG